MFFVAGKTAGPIALKFPELYAKNIRNHDQLKTITKNLINFNKSWLCPWNVELIAYFMFYPETFNRQRRRGPDNAGSSFTRIQ